MWMFHVHPWKLTCPQKRDYFSREYIFQPLIFRGHVSFQGTKFQDVLSSSRCVSSEIPSGDDSTVLQKDTFFLKHDQAFFSNKLLFENIFESTSDHRIFHVFNVQTLRVKTHMPSPSLDLERAQGPISVL